MLSCLRVRNFAIIDELEVELGPGLNVVTGETGAGKSILVDALELVLGARARPEVVRTGAAQAEVEALFTSIGPALAAQLRESGLDADGELLVRRVVTAQGRSRAYVNGSLVTATQLQALASGMVDISSQHEHHALSDPAAQLAYVDAFGGHDELLRAMRTSFDRLLAAHAAVEAARASERGRAEREDLLRFQLAELDELDPKPGESADLTRERERLRHAEKLLSASTAAEDALYGRDGSLTEELGQVCARLALAGALDPALAALADAVSVARAQLEDAARDLGAYARDVSLDPERLTVVEERSHALVRLSKKHGASGDPDPSGALAAKRDAARHELSELDGADARIAGLEASEAAARKDAEATAAALTEARTKAARRLGDAVAKELRGLGMGAARARLELRPLEARAGIGGAAVPASATAVAPSASARLSATGAETVELLVSANEGEALQPLRSIASGGELSRTMLAVKRVLATRTASDAGERMGLFVFDEVDAGVGGAVGEVIGRSLADVARHHAVLCITHLAPIAAYADRHFVVQKSVEDGRTKSRVVALHERERVEELARMVGGITITKKTRGVAVELLRGARATTASAA